MKKLKLILLLSGAIVAAVLIFNIADTRRYVVVMFAGADAVAYQEPRIVVAMTPGPPQPKVSPAEAGIDMAGIQAAVDYAGARNTRALIIGQGGHIVFEKYWDDSSLETPVDLSGFTPVLSALALGAAMNNERSINLDAPLGGYFDGWADDPRGAISLRQLLTRSSGFAKPDTWPWPGTRAARYALSADLRPLLLAWPLDTSLRQGESPAALNADILALALANKLEQPFDKLLAELIWRPIEGGEFSMARGDRAGCCIRARLGDWMRIGEVLANNGVFVGNQLTPPRYVGLMLQPTHPDSTIGFFTRVGGTFAARDVAWLESAGKQRLWIVPSLRLTILRVGDEPPESQGWDEAMIPDSIIRNVSGWQPRAVGEGVDPKKFAPH
jgi:CubicO group peptidase (beta-lactamase class C family)